MLSPSENKQEPGEKWLVGGCTEPGLKPGCDGEDADVGNVSSGEVFKAGLALPMKHRTSSPEPEKWFCLCSWRTSW